MKEKYNVLMGMLDEVGGSATEDTEGSSDTEDSSSVEIPEGKEWLQGVDSDLATDPSLQSIPDVPTLVKSYVHAQKMVGRDKVVIPDQNSSDEDWKNFFSKVGLPENPDEYEIQVPEGYLTEEEAAYIAQVAYDLNILPEQAEALLAEQAAIQAEREGSTSEEEELALEEAIEEMRQELGEEGFVSTLRQAKTVVEEFGGDDFMEYLEETGLDNDPEFIKFLANIGTSLNEDTFQPDAVQHLGVTKEDAEAEIAQMMGDGGHPYWNANHANHERAVKRMFKLQEILAK